MPSNSKPLLLSAIETRVLGVLAEKQRTVPDVYPMSLNALAAGCSQKSSRNPIMEVTEAEVQAALDGLKSRHLVFESSGGRVTRHAHNIERVLQIAEPAVALLAVLALRGPQTAGELRINVERLQKFADISAVEAVLRELAARPAGALVAELPRQPGSRETRWAHLLSGALSAEPVALAPAASHGTGADAVGALAALGATVARLEAEVADLKSVVDRMSVELAALRDASARQDRTA